MNISYPTSITRCETRTYIQTYITIDTHGGINCSFIKKTMLNSGDDNSNSHYELPVPVIIIIFKNTFTERISVQMTGIIQIDACDQEVSCVCLFVVIVVVVVVVVVLFFVF